MKNTFLIITLLFISKITVCQDPTGISYQAIIRDIAGQQVVNDTLCIQFSILKNSWDGEVVFVEKHPLVITNELGLISLVIGQGEAIISELNKIDWSDDNYYAKTEVSFDGGINYATSTISQFLSVPFAFYAHSAAIRVSSFGDTLFSGNNWVIIPGVSDANYQPGKLNPVNCLGVPTAVVEVTNPITGRIWMDRNLGALNPSSSSTDEYSYGDLYQWGRFSDGHQCRSAGTTQLVSTSYQPDHDDFIISPGWNNDDWLIPQNNELWQGVNGINNPCPEGFRIPTEGEWIYEILTWDSLDPEGAINSNLKLPLGGNRSSFHGLLDIVSVSGWYHSSTISSVHTRALMVFDTSKVVPFSRGGGASVRCIKDY